MISIKPAGTPVVDTTIAQPLDHLLACHRRIEERLGTFERVAEHLEQRPAEAFAALRNALRFMDSSGALHTEDEEQSVFPRLRERLTPQEIAYLSELEHQHRQADDLYVELKGLAARLEKECAPELLARYRAVVSELVRIYRAHIASEDETLIALGRRVFSGSELTEISEEMRLRRGSGKA